MNQLQAHQPDAGAIPLIKNRTLPRTNFGPGRPPILQQARGAPDSARRSSRSAPATASARSRELYFFQALRAGAGGGCCGAMAARAEPDGAEGTGAREARCAICWEWRALAEVGFLEGCLHWMCRGCALAWAGAGQGRPGAGAAGRGGCEGAEGGAVAAVPAAAAPMRCPLCRATCTGLIFPGNPVQRLRVGGPQAGTMVELGLRLSPRQLDRRRAYLAGHEAPGPGQLRALAAPGGRGPGRPAAVRAGAVAREVETFARQELEALTLSADVELLAKNSATVAVLGAVQGSGATDGGESWNEDARAALVTGLGGCLSPRQADLFSRYLLAFAETGVTLRSFDSLLEEYSETAWGGGGPGGRP